MTLPEIPQDQKAEPWVHALIELNQNQAKIIQKQAEQITALKANVQELKDEIARLKKTPKRPKFRPSGKPSNKGSHKPNNRKNTDLPQGDKAPKAKEEHILKPADIPKGSRFKGYRTYSRQELSLQAKDVIYKLEVWQAPDGTIIKLHLPNEIRGSHFGSELRALIHSLYASGMTQPAIFDFVQSTGIEISEGQIHNLLMEEAAGYEEQSSAILRAGLNEAEYIRVDDTGAKHKHKNGYCTHIGGEYFAYYKTTSSKSRINFLKILAQGKEGYTINDAFIWHLFQAGVEDDILNAFEAYKSKEYKSKKGLNRLLNQLELHDKKLRLTCHEAGLVGYIQEHILKEGQVLLSDRAGQFAVFDHAGCWIHVERPLRKLIATTEEIETQIQKVREAIWTLYAHVKEASLSQTGKETVKELYDKLIAMKVNSPGIQAVLNTFRDYREDLLKALDHPGLPLHNNDSERDIRSMVKFRKVSGSTKSDQGRSFRDSLMTLKQTCYRLGKNFWEYLKAWFRRAPIDLANCVRNRYRANSGTVP